MSLKSGIPVSPKDFDALGQDLSRFLSKALDPWSASRVILDDFMQAGAKVLDLREVWALEDRSLYVVPLAQRGVFAFYTGEDRSRFLCLSAHTDSPCLRLRLKDFHYDANLFVSQAETYGGLIKASMFDRPLRISGQAVFRHKGRLQSYLINLKSFEACIPQVAIHLNREVNKGFALDEAQHLRLLSPRPLDLLDESRPWESLALRAAQQDYPELESAGLEDILNLELEVHEANEAHLMGEGAQTLISCGRLDNLSGCHALKEAFIKSRLGKLGVYAFFFDHEETGSLAYDGADSRQIINVLKRVYLGRKKAPINGASWENQEQEFLASLSRSLLLSIDAAHGYHPNFAGLMDPVSSPHLGEGPAVKHSVQSKYAGDSFALAQLRFLAAEKSIPLQDYYLKPGAQGGTTLGPILASQSGIAALDLGIPLLAMHSARELGSVADQYWIIRMLSCFIEEADFGY